MKTQVLKYLADDAGAVTVDWVVLTAAVVGLGTLALITVTGGVVELADKIAHTLGTHNHGV